VVKAMWTMSEEQSIEVRTDADGDRARLTPDGPFDLNHAVPAARALDRVPTDFEGRASVDIDLAHVERIDGAGAVLLARLADRLDASGLRTRILERSNPEAAQLIALYRVGHVAGPATSTGGANSFARIGAAVAQFPHIATNALDFIGGCAIAAARTVAKPSSVDWRSLSRLLQEIGAGGLIVTGAANLLVGLIIGLLGISQLSRFGAVSYVPQLVVVAQFRELGPLVTAIVVAGRSGAGLASELATMKVSEEIDALRAMGFDPMRWLVVPRCIALVIVVPLLTWVGNALALVGGFAAASVITDMPPRAYLVATAEAITLGNLLGGLVKTPFLAMAIGVIACGQGLAAQGGAAAVGARTTQAVVLAILGVIVTNAVFTLFFSLMGI
jgi:phospholipid/cholesterol/gamma-HCH transport system permease protein